MISDICLMSDLFIYDRALFVEKVNKQQRKLRKKQLSSSLKKSDIRHQTSDIINQTSDIFRVSKNRPYFNAARISSV
jgi:hypothetical protein